MTENCFTNQAAEMVHASRPAAPALKKALPIWAFDCFTPFQPSLKRIQGLKSKTWPQ